MYSPQINYLKYTAFGTFMKAVELEGMVVTPDRLSKVFNLFYIRKKYHEILHPSLFNALGPDTTSQTLSAESYM